jgi:hypothetical protein
MKPKNIFFSINQVYVLVVIPIRRASPGTSTILVGEIFTKLPSLERRGGSQERSDCETGWYLVPQQKPPLKMVFFTFNEIWKDVILVKT